MNTAKELEGKPWGALWVGWWTNAYSATVGQGCASSVYHSTWHTDRTNAQGTGRFYATERDALLKLRWELCRKYAEELTKIDNRMAELPPTQPAR